MTRARRARLAAGALAFLAFQGAPGGAAANGAVQRDVQGRVASVDANAERLVVVREFRGRAARVVLRAQPGTRIFSCGAESMTLDRLRRGMMVSVFYEVVGTDGIANLILIEPPR